MDGWRPDARGRYARRRPSSGARARSSSPPAPGWASTPACPTSGATGASGRPTRPTSGSASPSWTRRTPPTSTTTRPSAGASTATARTSTARTVPHDGFRLLRSAGPSGCACRASSSPPTWTASSRRRASRRTASSRCTAPSTTSSARPRARPRSGTNDEQVRGGRGDDARAPASRAARAAARCPARTSSCSATTPGSTAGPPAQRERFEAFLEERRGRAPRSCVELGAGTAVPTIRMTSERLGARADALRRPRQPARGGRPRRRTSPSRRARSRGSPASTARSPGEARPRPRPCRPWRRRGPAAIVTRA